MSLLFGVCFFLYFLKLSAGKGFNTAVLQRVFNGIQVNGGGGGDLS